MYGLAFPALLVYLAWAEIQRETLHTSEGLERRWAQDVWGAPSLLSIVLTLRHVLNADP